MAKGTAVIDVAADFLSQLGSMLPSTYRVVGSEMNPSIGVVRLIVESEDIAGHDMIVTLEVKDAGSTRVAMVVPCGRIQAEDGFDKGMEVERSIQAGARRYDHRFKL